MGESARTIIAAIAKTVDESPVRFVHVGAASREETIELPGAALRASGIMLMGSGIGSVSRAALLQGIRSIFELVRPAGPKVATRVIPLPENKAVWENATGKPAGGFHDRLSFHATSTDNTRCKSIIPNPHDPKCET
jgi:hypothetical protein